MKWSQAFIPTLREDPQDAEVISHKLMVRGALIRKLTAGAYTYLPLGLKILSKVQGIIREEMTAAGAQEILMPALHPIELWQKTGRDKVLEEVMIKFRDRHGRIGCLGPTHEEVVTSLVAGNVSSYRDLPKTLYQIQTKFRDEMRPRFGVIRSCEFIMKDAYSFDADVQGLEKSYKSMFDAYCRIFKRCGLPYITVYADPGAMGGGESHEFMIPCDIGEDLVGVCRSCGYGASKDILVKGAPDARGSAGAPPGPRSGHVAGGELGKTTLCPKCNKEMDIKHTIEVGHTFKLGTKYSKPLSAVYLDAAGATKEIIMGCYGIGVNRILAATVETANDKDGMIWPVSLSPYEVSVLPLNMSVENVRKTGLEIYGKLIEQGVDAIIDDREDRAGVKFNDSDLIGYPLQIIIGEKGLKDGLVEIKIRKSKVSEKVKIEETVQKVKIFLDKLRAL
ncbi:MAG: proline--tRNA ligase [Candidatus Omnitrophica bacterium]|nr:proline--tRNA ligase [Candidatus Omnitrophota bacterium]